MCGRFYVPEKDLDDFAALVNKVEKDLLKKAGEMYPGDYAPVITPAKTEAEASPESREGEDVHIIKWGVPLQNGKLVFNARAETVHEKPLFKMPFASRRCLIPARGFFEWKDAPEEEKSKKRIKHYITLIDGQMMYFAGLYWFFKDREGVIKPHFTILTTEANEDIRTLHDRMPVIIPKDEHRTWLYEPPQNQRLLLLMRPMENGRLAVTRSE